jgi:hypothetical protein
LTAADVSAVEQDLRTSASPTFAAASTTGNFTVGAGGTLYALGNASVSNVLAVVNGIIDTGYITVSGSIISNGHTGFTGTLAAAISSGLNVSNGIIY